MGDQEAVLELGPGDLRELLFLPRGEHRRAQHAVAVDVDPEVGKGQQIGKAGPDLQVD
jgi:hypothetical protein